MKDYIIDKIGFTILLGIIALLTAGCAAVFSVYGIATLFAGAFVSVAIMAGVLEIAKLISVVYLYRYWKRTTTWLASYITIAVIVLMLITSLGIFGFLSAAYQKSSTEFKAQEERIVLVENTRTYAQDRIVQSQSRIELLNEMRRSQESRLSEALNNIAISRNPIALRQIQDQTGEMISSTESDIQSEQGKIETAIKDIQDIDQRVNELRFSKEFTDIRTFKFVAQLFDTDLDTVAKWFILALILVFDPLAIALILAYNVIVFGRYTPPTTSEVEDPIKKK